MTIQVGVAQQQAANIGQVIGAILGVGGGGNSRAKQTTIQADGAGKVPAALQRERPERVDARHRPCTSVDPNYGVTSIPVKFNLRIQ